MVLKMIALPLCRYRAKPLLALAPSFLGSFLCILLVADIRWLSG